MPSSSGGPEILGRVDEEPELGGEEALVAASQRIVLQRQLLRAKIRTCPEGHELREDDGDRAMCSLCRRDNQGVILCCGRCDWDICQECTGLDGLPHAHEADEDVVQRAVVSTVLAQSQRLRQKRDHCGAAVLLQAATRRLEDEALKMKESADPDHEKAAGTLHELGRLLRQNGDLNQAEHHLTEALRMKILFYGGADHESVAVTLHELGMLQKQKGDLEQAEEQLKEELDGADHVSVAGTLHALGMLLKQKGDLEQAEEYLKEELRMERSIYDGADHVSIAVTLHELGMLLKEKGDSQQAEEHLKEAVRMKESVYGGAKNENVAVTLHELGMVLKEEGDLDKTEEYLKEVLRKKMSEYGDSDQELFDLIRLLHQKRDLKQALRITRCICDGVFHEDFAVALSELSGLGQEGIQKLLSAFHNLSELAPKMRRRFCSFTVSVCAFYARSLATITRLR